MVKSLYTLRRHNKAKSIVSTRCYLVDTNMTGTPKIQEHIKTGPYHLTESSTPMKTKSPPNIFKAEYQLTKTLIQLISYCCPSCLQTSNLLCHHVQTALGNSRVPKITNLDMVHYIVTVVILDILWLS